MKYSLLILGGAASLVIGSTPAIAGKKDDAWAKCLWEHVPTSANNWIGMSLPKSRSAMGDPKPEYALQFRLQAACYEKLTKEGKSRPSRFNAKKVRKALIATKPQEVLEDTLDPKAYRCMRFFLNDKEMKTPAAYRWGFGEDTSQAQFFSVSYFYAAQGGGSVGLPESGGLEKCQFINADGTFTNA